MSVVDSRCDRSGVESERQYKVEVTHAEEAATALRVFAVPMADMEQVDAPAGKRRIRFWTWESAFSDATAHVLEKFWLQKVRACVLRSKQIVRV